MTSRRPASHILYSAGQDETHGDEGCMGGIRQSRMDQDGQGHRGRREAYVVHQFHQLT